MGNFLTLSLKKSFLCNLRNIPDLLKIDCHFYTVYLYTVLLFKNLEQNDSIIWLYWQHGCGQLRTSAQFSEKMLCSENVSSVYSRNQYIFYRSENFILCPVESPAWLGAVPDSAQLWLNAVPHSILAQRCPGQRWVKDLCELLKTCKIELSSE